jgi:hypothetical protein
MDRTLHPAEKTKTSEMDSEVFWTRSLDPGSIGRSK